MATERRRRFLQGGVGAGALAALRAGSAGAGGRDDQGRTVVEWIDRHAVPLASTDPGAPLGDLRALSRVAGAADVVGLGEATHGSHELFRVKHRLVRYLVERLGWRTVALEDDFAGGVALDRYVVTGEGDPRRLVADSSSPFWSSEEIVSLLQWMRAHNQSHSDKVRFLGTDVLVLRELSFDAVTGYVRRVAPDRLGEVEGALAPALPRGSRFEHQQWYFARPDEEKQQLIDSVRRVPQLLEGLPDHGPRLEREYARQHARAILGWYQNFAVERRLVREEFIADTVTWWQRTVGGKIAYWAASVHATAAPTVRLRVGGEEGAPDPFAGGILRRRLGRRYVAIGTTFHAGAINSGYVPPTPNAIGPPPAGLLDATLGEAGAPDYLLDLHAPAHGPVADWHDGPAAMRMIHPMFATGDDPAAYTMATDSLIGAFDALVHIRTTTPSQLIPWQAT